MSETKQRRSKTPPARALSMIGAGRSRRTGAPESLSTFQLDDSLKPREEEILKVAARMFLEKGYHGASMAEIASAIGIQKASLYYFFSGKEELLARIADAGVNRTVNALERVRQSELAPRARFQLAVQELVLISTEWIDGAWVALFEGPALSSEQRQSYIEKRRTVDRLMTDFIRDGIEHGDFRPVDARLTAFSVLSMVNGLLRWYRPDGKLGPHDLAAHFVDLMDAMLGAPALAARVEQQRHGVEPWFGKTDEGQPVSTLPPVAM